MVERVIREAQEAGEEAVKILAFTVPILTDSELEIFVRYQGLGRDMNGRALVSEQDAMLRMMRRMGYRFEDAAILECWDALAAEEAKYRAEAAKS